MEEEMKIKSEIISVKEWTISLLIMCIPIINVVFLILWGFIQDNVSQTKRNWAKATLILIAIEIILVIVIFGILAGFGICTMS
jgi:hypothetical protein